jgi:hypothetical protein
MNCKIQNNGRILLATILLAGAISTAIISTPLPAFAYY